MSRYFERYSSLINPVSKDSLVSDLEVAHYEYVTSYMRYAKGNYKYLRNHRFFRYYFLVNIVYIESLIAQLDHWLTDNIYHFEP